MNASHYALVAVTLGVLWLGRLPTGPPHAPGGTEPVPRPTALASTETDQAPGRGREPRLTAVEQWTAIKRRLLQSAGATAEGVTADPNAETCQGPQTATAFCPTEGIAAQAHPLAREEGSKTQSPLSEAELVLMRVLAAPDDRTESPPSASSLDDLARLISWTGQGENRAKATSGIPPTQDPSLRARAPVPTLLR
jgi:hypothetical protein